MKLLTALPITLALGLLSPTLGYAQGVSCGLRDAIVDRLYDRFGETRQSVGLGANNAMVEIFASDSTGTWTITVTTPGGPTCLVASGQSFETLASEARVLKEDA